MTPRSDESGHDGRSGLSPRVAIPADAMSPSGPKSTPSRNHPATLLLLLDATSAERNPHPSQSSRLARTGMAARKPRAAPMSPAAGVSDAPRKPSDGALEHGWCGSLSMLSGQRRAQVHPIGFHSVHCDPSGQVYTGDWSCGSRLIASAGAAPNMTKIASQEVRRLIVSGPPQQYGECQERNRAFETQFILPPGLSRPRPWATFSTVARAGIHSASLGVGGCPLVGRAVLTSGRPPRSRRTRHSARPCCRTHVPAPTGLSSTAIRARGPVHG